MMSVQTFQPLIYNLFRDDVDKESENDNNVELYSGIQIIIIEISEEGGDIWL